MIETEYFRGMLAETGRQVAVVLYVVAMVAIIVGVDFDVLQKPILGTADSEYWHCLGVRSFLLDIPQASIKTPLMTQSGREYFAETFIMNQIRTWTSLLRTRAKI